MVGMPEFLARFLALDQTAWGAEIQFCRSSGSENIVLQFWRDGKIQFYSRHVRETRMMIVFRMNHPSFPEYHPKN